MMDVAGITSLLHGIRGFSGLQFNPRILLAAVNFLHGMGFAAAVKLLEEYCMPARNRTSANPENVFLVARILFVRKKGEKGFPPLLQGAPDVEAPADTNDYPVFPLYVIEDIPFLLIGGYTIGGQGESPRDHLVWCRTACLMRKAPLRPHANPLACVDSFLGSSTWKKLRTQDWHVRMLRLQALRAVSNIHSLEKPAEKALLSDEAAEQEWQRQRQSFGALKVAWNSATNDYILK